MRGGRECSRAEKEWERDAGRKTIAVCVCHSTVNPEQEKKQTKKNKNKKTPKDLGCLSPSSYLRFGSEIQHSVQHAPRNIGWNEEEEMTDRSYTSQVAVSCDTPVFSLPNARSVSQGQTGVFHCPAIWLPAACFSFSLSAITALPSCIFTSRQPSPRSALKLNIKCINYQAIIPRNLYGCRI